MSKQTKPIRPFTFTYKETAKAQFSPTATVQCEGVEFSDGMVALKTPERQWYGYRTLDEMFEAYKKHGKGKIRFISTQKEEEI